VENAFKDTDFKISKFGNGAEFIKAVESDKFDLVFLDLMMPEMNGYAVLQYLSTHDTELPVIVLTALTRKESVQKAMDFGIKSYLVKPVKPEGIVRKAVEVLKTNF
jgi:CheY-like chemotaxis protein